MILIAEAGATSTRWRAIDAAGRVTSARSGGVNVATIARAVVEDRIATAVAELNPAGEKLERVHFYAAGMLADANFVGVPMTELRAGQRIEHNRFGGGLLDIVLGQGAETGGQQGRCKG